MRLPRAEHTSGCVGLQYRKRPLCWAPVAQKHLGVVTGVHAVSATQVEAATVVYCGSAGTLLHTGFGRLHGQSSRRSAFLATTAAPADDTLATSLSS